MIRILKTLFVVLLIVIPFVSVALPGENKPLPEKPTDLKMLSDYYAEKYGVSKNVMRTVVQCESRWNTNAIGDNGNSHGLVQIHLPSHPTILKVEATNPDFALNFLAKNLSQGKGAMWTCYRNNYQQ